MALKKIVSLNVRLYTSVATMILVFSNLIFVLPLNNINGQHVDKYVNFSSRFRLGFNTHTVRRVVEY